MTNVNHNQKATDKLRQGKLREPAEIKVSPPASIIAAHDISGLLLRLLRPGTATANRFLI
jgi:hypothetical protein